MNLEVLYEDNHCLAVNKPAGCPRRATSRARRRWSTSPAVTSKQRYDKPGNVYVGLVHRLDRPTSGVVLLARTSKAAGRLSAQFRAGTSRRSTGRSSRGARRRTRATGPIDWRRIDGPTNRGRWRDRKTGGKAAEVAFRVLERWPGAAMLELRPVTGRSHQLRVQLASRGLPIVGDAKYGARSRIEADRRRRPDRAARTFAAIQSPDSWGSDRGRGAGAGRLARALAIASGIAVRDQ